MKIKTLSGLLLFEDDSARIKETLVAAVRSGAYLGGADLGGAYLGGAYLRGAYLGGAYLRGAYLGGADLGGADLGGAYLGGADLRGAYLRGAKINWQSHAILSEIILRAAGDDVDKRKIAGLVAASLDWCWDRLLGIDDPLSAWALSELAKWITEDDSHPRALDAHVAEVPA